MVIAVKELNFYKIVPEGMKYYSQIEKYFTETNIDPVLKELIKLRASQINGCARCLGMHIVDAEKIGISHQKMMLLDAWNETSLFTEKEKLVIELTERLTLVASHGMDEDLYERLAKYFSEKEFAILVLIISQINVWNRINVAGNRDIDPNYK